MIDTDRTNPGQLVLCDIREQAEQAMEREPGSSFTFLPPGHGS